MKRYSIIIPCYKSKQFIEECLDSVVSSVNHPEGREYEILCGVDGCVETLDKLKEISKKYKNLKIFFSKDNVGTYVTTNFLLSKCMYDEIVKFDSDDVMCKDLILLIEEEGLKERNLCFVNFRGQSFSGDLTLPLKSPSSLTGGVWWAVKSTFDVVGGFKPWKCAADSDIVLRFKKAGVRCAVMRSNGFYRRIHESSLTQDKQTGFGSRTRESYVKQLGKGPLKIIPETGNFGEVK